jgi:glycosyltransferase involved in cell wall biosynthesis
MRVLHVVTLHSPDNAFGGPMRVALNLAGGLRQQGAEVRLLTMGRGFAGKLPTDVEGVPAHVLRARQLAPQLGFSGIAAPGLLPVAARLIRGCDVVHVHLARDLMTVPVAALANALGKPVVLQTHGMVDPSGRALAAVLDAVAVRRLLRRAARVLYLTEHERRDLQAVAGAQPLTNLSRLPNGVPLAARRATPGDPLVTFLGRLHPRKRPEAVVAAMPAVLRAYPRARCVIAGPDEGAKQGTVDLARRLGLEQVVDIVGAVDHAGALELLRRTSVSVLPSVDEPFPMSVLEALAVGTPVVLTRSNGLARDVLAAGAGAVVDVDEDVSGDVVRLLDRAENERASAAAHELAGSTFDVDRVVKELCAVYEDAIRRR